MLTLEFRDQLVNNAFSYGNNFLYINLRNTGIFLGKNPNEENPFIGRSYNYHKEEELHISVEQQLQNRAVTPARLKEIMDSARVPIGIRYGGLNILAGKGFLALRDPNGGLGRLLMVACENAAKPATSISQVRYYVLRAVLTVAEYKRLGSIVRSFMDSHTGEILISDDIDQYIGRKISIPKVGTLAQKKEFVTKLIEHCIKPFCAEKKGEVNSDEDAIPKKKNPPPSEQKREGIDVLTSQLSEDEFFEILDSAEPPEPTREQDVQNAIVEALRSIG